MFLIDGIRGGNTAKAGGRRPGPEGRPRSMVGAGNPSAPIYKEMSTMEFDILSAITTVGFPIVFCLLLFWYLREETNNHKAEMMDLKQVISENNTILASLKQLIEDKLNKDE